MTQMIYYLLCLSCFIVAIDGKLSTCPRYPDPKNGRMICDQLIGKYCSPECHTGFEPSSDAAWAYICNLTTKKWVTYPENYPIPWPDCIPESSRTSRSHGNRSHARTNEDMLKNLNVVSNFISNVIDQPAKSINTTETGSGNNGKQTTKTLNTTETSNTTHGMSPKVSENIEHKDNSIKEDHSPQNGEHGEKVTNTSSTATKKMNCFSNETNNGKKTSKDESNDCDIKSTLGTPDATPENNSSTNKNSKINKNNSNTNKIDSSVEENKGEESYLTQNHDSIKPQKKSKLTTDDPVHQLLRSHTTEEEGAYGSADKEIQEDNQKAEANITVRAVVKKPLVPVFSADDLNLLRHIVSNFNIKRSDLLHSSSSLWSKMVQLTSNRNSPFLGKRRMLPRKLLAHKDIDVARLIMNDVNKARAYSLRHHMRHPMRFIQLLKHSRAKFENPFSRQYVFNGATFVPVPVDGPAPSYLNSDKGGGLSEGARYRWNGATFVPVNPEDLPIVSEETDIKSDDKDKKVPDNAVDLEKDLEKAEDPGYDPYQSYPGLPPDPNSKYVFNGATFVPLAEGRGKDVSYLNTEFGYGLTPEAKYKWNGATFVTKDDDAQFSVNSEIQRILDMWNNNNNNDQEENKHKEPDTPPKAVEPQPTIADESNKEPEQRSSPTQAPPTYNPFLPTEAPEPSTPKPSVESSSEKRSDKLFYWDGVQYAPVASVRKLPIGTMRYKKVNGNFEQVDIVNESTYKDVKDEKELPDYQAQLQALREQQERQEQKAKQPETPSAEFTANPPSPDVHENSEKNSGVELKAKYIWNGATFVPSQDDKFTTEPYMLADKIPALYEWTGMQFLPTLDTGTKFLYTWNGANFVPYVRNIYAPPPPPANPVKPTQPSRTSAYQAQDNNNAPNQAASGTNLFDARINYPKVSSNEKDIDLNPAAKGDDGAPTTPQTTTPTTTPTTTTPAIIPPRNPYLPTSKKEDEGPDEKSKFKDQLADSKPDESMLLPPPNPYLPTDKGKDSNDVIAKLEEKQDTSSSLLLPPPNPYLPGVTNETSEDKGHRAPIPTTPMMHTRVPKAKEESSRVYEENLEGVIKHDPDLKSEIEDLTRKYEESPGSTPVSLPSSHALNDKALLEFDSQPSIDKVLDNDLKQKAPEELNALRDIDAADHLLQREEEKQNYYGPTARVKEADEDDEATRQLKAALDKIEEKKREKYRPTSTLIDSLSTNDKGKLEKSLQEDMDKLTSNSFGKSNGNSQEPSLKSYKDSGLNVQDLRELLEITKLAERQATAKKFGLTRPNLSYLHPMKVLRKKSVRDFLRYLIKRHALTKALTRLNLKDYPTDTKPPIASWHGHPISSWHGPPYQRKKEEKYQNSVRKLVSEWNKSYKDITKKQHSALPKFHG